MTVTMTPLPAAPQRSDPPAVFIPKADNFVAALSVFQTEANALSADASASSAAANAQAVIATTQAGIATTQAAFAAASATQAGITANAPKWDVTTTYANLANAVSPANAQTYRRTAAAGSGGLDPSISPDWTRITAVSIGGGGASSSGSTILTNVSGGSQVITPTTFGQFVKLPDATTMAIGTTVFSITNAGNFDLWVQDGSGVLVSCIRAGDTCDINLRNSSTIAGEWYFNGSISIGVDVDYQVNLATTLGNPSGMKAVTLDSNRTLLILLGDQQTHAIVYDASTLTFGSPTLVRPVAMDLNSISATLAATDKVLVASCASTALSVVCLSVSGSSITVNTAAPVTLSAASARIGDIVPVGTSFGLTVYRSGAVIFGITLTGVTVAIGAELVLSGTVDHIVPLYAIAGQVCVALSATTTPAIVADVVTITGTSCSIGIPASLPAASTSVASTCITRKLTSGRIAVVYDSNSGNLSGTLLTVAGTTATFSTPAALMAQVGGSTYAIQSGNQLVVCNNPPANGNIRFNVLTDNSGVAVAGTAFTIATSVATIAASIGLFNSEAWFSVNSTNGPFCMLVVVGISGNSPVVSVRNHSYTASVSNQFASISAPSTWMPNSELAIGVIKTGSKGFCAKSSNVSSFGLLATKRRMQIHQLPSAGTSAGASARSSNAYESWNLNSNPGSTTTQIQKVRIV